MHNTVFKKYYIGKTHSWHYKDQSWAYDSPWPVFGL